VPVWLNVVITIVGTIGLTTLGNLWIRSRDLGSGRRLIRLQHREPLSIVLVTSGNESGGIEGVQYRRHTVSLATLLAATTIAGLTASLGYRKPHEIAVSETISRAPTGDIVLLGGPIKNRLSMEFIERFNRTFPENQIRRDLREGRRVLQVGEYEAELTQNVGADGQATRDVALLVM